MKAAHPLDIPDFLKWQNRGKKIKVSKKANGSRSAYVKSEPRVDPVEVILAKLEPELRSHIEAEVKAGRAQRRWLEDPSTIQLFRDELKARADRKAEGMARLAALKEERAKEKALLPPKPVFGAGTIIRVLVKDNPRKAGTGSHERFAKMAAFVRKYPKATVAEVMEATGYRKDDLAWDESRKAIKLDIVRKDDKPN